MTPPPADPGGHLRRATDPEAPASDERETVASRVHEMVADAAARERAASGRVAPQWRAIERKLAEGFHPPLAVVKQENVAKALAHQMLRSWLDGEPRGRKMGWIKLKRGHQALLPANSAYQFRSAKPAVVVLQTCKGDLSIERWAEICQTH